MIFHRQHVKRIKDGSLTEYRQLDAHPPAINSTVECVTKPDGPPFACVRITSLRREWLWDITPEALAAEGYHDKHKFIADMATATGISEREARARRCWVVGFEVTS